jgi:hypothetical protein
LALDFDMILAAKALTRLWPPAKKWARARIWGLARLGADCFRAGPRHVFSAGWGLWLGGGWHDLLSWYE